MIKIGRTVWNIYTGKKGIVTTICEKGHLSEHLRIKYEDGSIGYQLQHDLRTRKPSAKKAEVTVDNLSNEQIERIKKTAQMVGLSLRETAEEMAEAGLLEVQREKGDSD